MSTYTCQLCGETVNVIDQPTHMDTHHTATEGVLIDTRESNCEADDHVWVGGMCYVDNEDADTVNAERLANGLDPLECERCDAKYGEDD